MSQFTFLQREWPQSSTPRREQRRPSTPIRARPASTPGARWSWRSAGPTSTTPRCGCPTRTTSRALIHEPTFKQAAGEAVFSKARVINDARQPRRAQPPRRCPEADALAAVRELFHVCYWFARTYARARRARRPGSPSIRQRCPRPRADADADRRAAAARWRSGSRERDEKLATLLADKARARRGAEAPARRGRRGQEAAAAQPDTHDYSEAETRDYFIDLLLKEAAGRSTRRATASSRSRDAERQGKGFVDYVLWGDDGKPLGLVEAKRTRRDPRVGQQQAKLYADCLERQFGQRPVIFYSNGYEHWIWDDARYPPRPVQGFYKKAELELLIQRRETRKPLAEAAISSSIVERYYQTRAIRRIAEAFERDHERKALLVMATGAGKTRTVIALVRSADALQLGQARAVPRRPRGAGEPGGQRVQAAPARRLAGQPGHREGRRGPRLRLDLSDDDGPDRRGERRPAALRGRPLRSRRSSTRRTARCSRSIARSSTTSIRCSSA